MDLRKSILIGAAHFLHADTHIQRPAKNEQGERVANYMQVSSPGFPSTLSVAPPVR